MLNFDIFSVNVQCSTPSMHQQLSIVSRFWAVTITEFTFWRQSLIHKSQNVFDNLQTLCLYEEECLGKSVTYHKMSKNMYGDRFMPLLLFSITEFTITAITFLAITGLCTSYTIAILLSFALNIINPLGPITYYF